MDTALDEDFVNFECVSQICASSPLLPGVDEELCILDSEVRKREEQIRGDKEGEENNNDLRLRALDGSTGRSHANKVECPWEDASNEDCPLTLLSESSLLATYSYIPASKKLTMMPIKCKIKEERRKVLKISVSKLKKIDDPESWLCRSVLINNTMKKLQKETRDEKINKQSNAASLTYSMSYLAKNPDDEDVRGESDRNKSVSGNGRSGIVCLVSDTDPGGGSNIENDEGDGGKSTFIQELRSGAGETESARLCRKLNLTENEFNGKGEIHGTDKSEGEVEVRGAGDKTNCGFSRGVSLNEDVIEQIPFIKRCAPRKKSLDEEGTRNEMPDFEAPDPLELCCKNEKIVKDDRADECDVHDFLSQLYIPPTPRMLTSIDSDTEEDELNIVDIDSSYVEEQKLPRGPDCREVDRTKRRCEHEIETDGTSAKRRKIGGVFNCFNACGILYDNFLCGDRHPEIERTCTGAIKETWKGLTPDEQLIKLEDDQHLKKRFTNSLSSQYHRSTDKLSENFFEDTCDSQYSCGHTVTMFGEIQSVTFHNLIAGLET